jgi:hypothetical protein
MFLVTVTTAQLIADLGERVIGPAEAQITISRALTGRVPRCAFREALKPKSTINAMVSAAPLE